MIRRQARLVVVATAAALALVALVALVLHLRRPERIVLVTLDTLRSDALYGGELYDGPPHLGGADDEARPSAMPMTLDWARGARIFTRFYASTASTQPTHASIFTGLSPWEHGMTGNAMHLPVAHPTFVERLQAAGWSTAAVVASFPVSRTFGFARGFDSYRERFDRGRVGGEWRRAGAGGGEHLYTLADSVAERAIEILDGTEARRSFLWIHFFDPHSPYGDLLTDEERLLPRSRVRGVADGAVDPVAGLAEARLLYELDAAHLDGHLRRVLDRIAADGVESHVLLVSDHGESFGEDGSVGHGKRVTPPAVRVPLVLRSPRVPAGIDERVASSPDIAATVLSLAGLEPLGRGRDLTRAASGDEQAFGMRRTYRHPFEEVRVDGSIHLHERPVFFFVDDRGVLYRGTSDALLPPEAAFGEMAVSPVRAAEVRAVFAELESRLARAQALRASLADRDALEELGYVE